MNWKRSKKKCAIKNKKKVKTTGNKYETNWTLKRKKHKPHLS